VRGTPCACETEGAREVRWLTYSTAGREERPCELVGRRNERRSPAGADSDVRRGALACVVLYVNGTQRARPAAFSRNLTSHEPLPSHDHSCIASNVQQHDWVAIDYNVTSPRSQFLSASPASILPLVRISSASCRSLYNLTSSMYTPHSAFCMGTSLAVHCTFGRSSCS
jgi:hypothetical protein